MGASNLALSCHRTHAKPTGRMGRSGRMGGCPTEKTSPPGSPGGDARALLRLLANDLDDPVRTGVDQHHLIVDHRISVTPDRRHFDRFRERIELARRGDLHADTRPEVRRRRDHDPLARDRAVNRRALVGGQIDDRRLGSGNSRRGGEDSRGKRTIHNGFHHRFSSRAPRAPQPTPSGPWVPAWTAGYRRAAQNTALRRNGGQQTPASLPGLAWSARQACGISPSVPHRAVPIVHFATDLIGAVTVAVLDLAFEIFSPPLDRVEVLVRQLRPFLLDLALDLLP